MCVLYGFLIYQLLWDTVIVLYLYGSIILKDPDDHFYEVKSIRIEPTCIRLYRTPWWTNEREIYSVSFRILWCDFSLVVRHFPFSFRNLNHTDYIYHQTYTISHPYGQTNFERPMWWTCACIMLSLETIRSIFRVRVWLSVSLIIIYKTYQSPIRYQSYNRSEMKYS